MLVLTRWNELREVILARDKKCAICGHTGDYFNPLQVDHILEVASGGAMWDKKNLQVLCSNCHKIKTAKFNARRKLKQDIAKGVQKTLK
jgi:5-methylcytosine-specific restriction protein A